MQTIRTPENRAQFLEALSRCANVSEAAKIAGVGRMALYDWRKDDPDFAADWEAAVDLGTEALEDEAVRRAHEGTLKPVFYQGAECGHVREYSDTLLIFMLKARRPDKYRDNARIEHTGPNGGPVAVQVYLPDNGRDDANPSAAEAGTLPR